MLLPVAEVHIPHTVRVHAVERQVGHIEDPDGEHRADGVGAKPFESGIPVIRAYRPRGECLAGRERRERETRP